MSRITGKSRDGGIHIQLFRLRGQERRRGRLEQTRNPQPNIRSQRTEVRRQIFRLQIVLLNAPCSMRSALCHIPATRLSSVQSIQSEIPNPKSKIEEPATRILTRLSYFPHSAFRIPNSSLNPGEPRVCPTP